MQKKIKKVICFDIDGVICKTKKNDYKKAIPIKKNIRLINRLYSDGYVIKVFTARFMGRNNDNKAKAKKAGYLFTKKSLKDWGLKYNKLIFSKPSYDLIVDDKAIFFKQNWADKIYKELKGLR